MSKDAKPFELPASVNEMISRILDLNLGYMSPQNIKMELGLPIEMSTMKEAWLLLYELYHKLPPEFYQIMLNAAHVKVEQRMERYGLDPMWARYVRNGAAAVAGEQNIIRSSPPAPKKHAGPKRVAKRSAAASRPTASVDKGTPAL